MLPADELARLQSDIDALLPDTCTLLSPVETRGSDGSVLVTWGTAATSVKCRFDPLTGSEQTAAGAAQVFQGYRVTLPADTTVTTAYRVVKGGITYNIITADPGKSLAGSVRLLVQKA